jgi:glycosyltransferase involved in cell wall biosynthesis
VTVSEAVHKMAIGRLYYKNLFKIYNGINTTVVSDAKKLKALKESLGIENSYPIIIHVGRATKEKRQEDIIRAVAGLLVSYPLLKLLLIGREVKKGYAPLVTELNLEHSVLLLDERNDIADLLHISDIGVFPSLYEGLPLALIEMMAAGLPLIVSDIAALRDITGSGGAAIYVPVKNPDSINSSLKRLLSDRDLMEQLGTNGRKIVQERFSLTKMVKEYTNIYLNG